MVHTFKRSNKSQAHQKIFCSSIVMAKSRSMVDNGRSIMKTLSQELKRTLPENIKMEVIYTGAKLESQVNIKDPIPKRHNHNIITPFAQGIIARKITMNVQENSKKELKITMVEIKTHVCYVTRYKLDIMRFQNHTYPNNWRKLSSPNPKKENL